MPCQSAYMEPTARERESVRVMGLMAEVGLIKHKSGCYGEPANLDMHTSQLCEFCQKNDATKYSLELQIWWRDHQIADKKRVERELEESIKKGEREEALKKLTDHEKRLLGLD